MWVRRSTRHACLLVWAILCVLVGAPASASAFEIKTTTSGQPVHWEPANVPFLIDPSAASMAPGASVAISTALQAWSSAGGGPALSALPAASASHPEVDGNNVVYFAPAGDPLARNAIAITIVTYDDTTGNIIDTDIVMNGIYVFGVLPDGSTPPPGAPEVSNEADGAGYRFPGRELGTFDITHVIAHETGHALGMGDETVNDSPLMFLFSKPGDATHRAPTSDDLAGIGELYADAGSERGCSSSTLSPRRARPSTLALTGVIVVLGIALLRMRRATFWKNGVVVGAAFAVVGALPSGALVAPDATSSVVHPAASRARVVSARATEVDGPWRTEVSLSILECRSTHCTSQPTFTGWGGRRGHLVQQIGDEIPPAVGDEVLVDVDDDGSVRAIHAR
jgi:hypothetical protein